MKWIVALAVIGFGIYLGVSFWEDRALDGKMRDAARDMLGNLHPRYYSSIRRRLVETARRLGAHVDADAVRFERRPTERAPGLGAVAGRFGIKAQRTLVAIELPFWSKVIGFRQDHRIRVEKVILTEPTRDMPSTVRGAGGPLPEFAE